MGILGTVLLVVFIIVCILLVLLVAIQGDEENGMGGLLGGRGTAAFGSQSLNVLTKATAVLVALFFVLSIGLALVNRTGSKDTVLDNVETEETSEESAETETNAEWWNDTEEAAPEVEETIENAEDTAEAAVESDAVETESAAE